MTIVSPWIMKRLKIYIGLIPSQALCLNSCVYNKKMLLLRCQQGQNVVRNTLETSFQTPFLFTSNLSYTRPKLLQNRGKI